MGLSPQRRLLLVTICSLALMYHHFSELPESKRELILSHAKAGLLKLVTEPWGTLSNFLNTLSASPGGKYLPLTAALAVLSKLIAIFFRRRIEREEAAADAAATAAVQKASSDSTAGKQRGKSAKGKHKTR